MASEILTGSILIAFSVYGELCVRHSSSLRLHSYLTSPNWRKIRKAEHEGLNVCIFERYLPLQEAKVAALVVAMMKEPDHWG